MTWEQAKATAQFLLDSIIGRIAIALGGISIGDWKPLSFLADWGKKRIEDAQRNFAAAMNAQASANFALSQVTILTGGSLASNVPGGVTVSDQFVGASANTLSSQAWTRTSDGPGGGGFGPDGSGKAVWKKSGGLWRRHLDISATPLATDYPAVLVVLAAPVESPWVGLARGPDAWTYLIARSNSSATTFVYARLGFDSLQVGCNPVSGDWTPGPTVPSTIKAGDQWVLMVGTSTDPLEVIVKQNGITRVGPGSGVTYIATDTIAAQEFRHVGVGSLAVERNFFLDQTRPAEIEVWSAADRQATTV